ncbi:hypothetical protein [uncultured Croceicoccus sp.]|nr:hypothetical protein [uncultured Croceicoccus sp.]
MNATVNLRETEDFMMIPQFAAVRLAGEHEVHDLKKPNIVDPTTNTVAF